MRFQCKKCGSIKFIRRGAFLECRDCKENFPMEDFVDAPRGNAGLGGLERAMDDVRKSVREQVDAVLADIRKSLGEVLQDLDIDTRNAQNAPLHPAATDDGMKKKAGISAAELLDMAVRDDDFVAPASYIYSDVEKNLIKKFKLRHENKRFVMTFDELCEFTDNVFFEGKPVWRAEWSHRLTGYTEDLVEMPMPVRFYKAKVPVDQLQRGTEMWRVLNWTRHQSPENEDSLKRFYEENHLFPKTYFKEMLQFFTRYGLYTRDGELTSK